MVYPFLFLFISTSWIIDRGSCPLETADQRGFSDLDNGTRVVDAPDYPDDDDACDIGATERFADDPASIFSDGFETGDTSLWQTVP